MLRTVLLQHLMILPLSVLTMLSLLSLQGLPLPVADDRGVEASPRAERTAPDVGRSLPVPVPNLEPPLPGGWFSVRAARCRLRDLQEGVQGCAVDLTSLHVCLVISYFIVPLTLAIYYYC